MKGLLLFTVFLAFFAYWFFFAGRDSPVKAAVGDTPTASLISPFNPTVTASQTNVPGFTATLKPVILPSITPVIESTNTLLPPGQSPGYMKPILGAFISVPDGAVIAPYIILSGFQTYTGTSGPVSISGTVGQKTFECANSPCLLDFPQSGIITFHAKNGYADVSEENQANILVTSAADGYYLSVISLRKFVIFSDSCGSLWRNLSSDRPAWATFPQNPSELNSQKTLHYLASRLMASGVVDAKDCPGGGSDGSAPNPCGLAKVKEKMVAWQNQYDFDIWLTGRDQHLPPVLLKSVLEIESQFWPVTQRLFLDEIGLGQINQLGVDVLLRTNPALYQRVCASAMYNCSLPYVSLSGLDRALIRGSLVMAMDSSCPDCQYGVNLNKAFQSIPLIAQVLYSNCMQSRSILGLHGFTANYDDNWKFTMVSYHSGFGCLQNALSEIPDSGREINWKDVYTNLSCPGSAEYVDRLWTILQGYEINQKTQPFPVTTVQLQTPTLLPPQPTQALRLSHSRLVVRVFVDLNGDGIRQDNEAVDNVQVNLDIAGGTRIQVTQRGGVVFELNGLQIGSRGRVSLPGLYRSAPILVPESGDLPIIFIFIKPVLPTRLP